MPKSSAKSTTIFGRSPITTRHVEKQIKMKRYEGGISFMVELVGRFGGDWKNVPWSSNVLSCS